MTITKEELEAKGFTHSNAVTGRIYLGLVNQSKLQAHSSTCKEWVTYYQCKKKGWSIKSGSMGVVIAYVEYKDEGGHDIQKPVVSFHTVFNLNDVDITTASSHNPISDKQKYLITKLIKNRYLEKPQTLNELLGKVNYLSSKKASEVIKQLKERKAVI